MLIQEIIRAKRDGEALSCEAIDTLVEAITADRAGNEQLGAFAMAVYLNGMNDDECVALTEAMRDSGTVMRWDDPVLPGPVLDKHSTGGVGDSTSLLLGPWVAACGGFVPMIVGPGLGHTGGTLDKMATIPGYNVAPGPDEFQRVVRNTGVAIIGQTADLALADRRLYGVRDVTATVESVPLIVASILSKKLAEGLDALVMDIKTGNGAVMPEPEAARHLARALARVAGRAGTPVTAVISDMSQPLGRNAGNALEVREHIELMTGDRTDSTLFDLSRRLAAEMLVAGGLAETPEDALSRLDRAFAQGHVAERFARMVRALGGPADLLDKPDAHLAQAPVVRTVTPSGPGTVTAIDVRRAGLAVVALGGGRRHAGDSIDPAVGLTGLARIGEAVDGDRPLAVVHARSDNDAERAIAEIRAAYTVGNEATAPPPLVAEIIREEHA